MCKPLWTVGLCGVVTVVLGVGDIFASNYIRDKIRFRNLDRFQVGDSGYKPGTIVVSFGSRKLFHVDRRGQVRSYPIAIPAKTSEWAGVSRVSNKRKNPGWGPTRSMRRENPNLPRYVRGGDPKNPLGERALYLGRTLYRIHGTNEPWLIGRAVSHGCIRMYNEDVKDLYERVKIGARVVVTWKKYDALPVDAPGYREDDRKSGNIRVAKSTVRAPELPERGLRKRREKSAPAFIQTARKSGAVTPSSLSAATGTKTKYQLTAKRAKAKRRLNLATLKPAAKRHAGRGLKKRRLFRTPHTVGKRSVKRTRRALSARRIKRQNSSGTYSARRSSRNRRRTKAVPAYPAKPTVAGWVSRLIPIGVEN